MSISGDDCRRRFRDAPATRTAAELYCLSLVFRFWEGNNDGRKLATIVVVLVWGSIETGAAFGLASPPEQFFYIRVGVGILVGRMWGIQFNNFAGVEFTDTNSGSGGGSDDE